MFHAVRHLTEIDDEDLAALPAHYELPTERVLDLAVVVGVTTDPTGDTMLSVVATTPDPVVVVDKDCGVAYAAGTPWRVGQVVTLHVAGAWGHDWHCALLGVSNMDVMGLPHPETEIPAVIRRADWLTT